MLRFIIKRLLQAIPLLIIVSAVLFILTNQMGDPLASFGGGRKRIRPEDRARLTRQLSLDKPVLEQYLIWLVGNDWIKIDANGDGIPDEYGIRKGVLRGDFGVSFSERRPALDVIGERVNNTLLLMVTSEVVVIIFSLFIGVYSALHQYSWIDHLITGLSFVGYSMPVFWLALILMYIFAVNFKAWGLPYFPTVGMYDLTVGPTFGQIVWHLILPVTTISVISIAGYSRYIRAQMLEVISQDYIRTVYAKGVPQWLVVVRHALKNAALPLVTIVGLDLPLLLGGATVAESIFAWPGMGRLYWDATKNMDIPVMMGILIILSALVIVFQIITDITYTLLDPRIRYD
jgi:peptide/nickel transport system permease protein